MPLKPPLPAHDDAAQWPASAERIPLQLLTPGLAARDGWLTPAQNLATGPLVSCLMVSRGRLLPARYAIACFCAQSYPRRELVIIDDNPASELTAFLAELRHPQIRHILLAETSANLGQLRNRALSEAHGDLVCQWDDDDLYDARRLAWQIEALQMANAKACFLQRWTMWWPAERRLAVSGKRLWEGSMLAQRSAVPPYPDQRRGEDSSVANALVAQYPVLTMDAPALYCYTIHGGNTFHYEHFLSMYNAASQFAGRAAYDQTLQLIAHRLPILDYANALGQDGKPSQLQRSAPPALPDRFVDPARLRPGRTPSCPAPLVSIIVRSMGRASLVDALASLAAQSYRNLDIVIVDATGGRHPPLPAAMAADARFRLVSSGKPLQRPAAANAGLDASMGEYVGFLDDDDLFDPDHVALLMRRVLAPDHPDFVYAGLWLVDRYHRLLRCQSNRFNILMFQFFNLIPAISVLVHRRVVELGCRFDESLDVFEDWDFWLQIVPHVQIARIEAPTQYYFVEAGTSGTSIGLNADPARGGHFSIRVRKRWEPTGAALWRDYLPLVHHLLARFHDGERASVRPAMRQLLLRYPAEPNLEFHLGRTYQAQGYAFSARRLFESAVSHNRSSLEFVLSLAHLWEAQGSPEDALACLEESRPALTLHLAQVDQQLARLHTSCAQRTASSAVATAITSTNAVSRNAPCPCNSGARYKHCCGAAVTVPAAAAPQQALVASSLQLQCDQLQTMAAKHYRQGDLFEARACLQQATNLLPAQAMVNHTLALLAFDLGDLPQAMAYSAVALAASADPVILDFDRSLRYRSRRMAEDDQLRAALRKSTALLAPDAVRARLAQASVLVVLGCNPYLPLSAVDFAGWQGRIHFLPDETVVLPPELRANWPQFDAVLLIDGLPEILPALLDDWLPAQVLVRVTRDCPAMLLEIAQAASAAIGLLFPDQMTAEQIGLPGLLVRPTLPESANTGFTISPRLRDAPFRVGLRAMCEADGMHPLDTMLIRRLLANGISLHVHGGGMLLRHFPPSDLPANLHLISFDAPLDQFLAGIDCLLLRRAPLADPEAAIGFVAQAMAASCPVICAGAMPGAELLNDGENGFRLAADDDDAICQRIAQLQQDPVLNSAMRVRAKATARRYWTQQAQGPWRRMQMEWAAQ
ncbi:MAG: glycosyltransferase [Pseudomonadota bacterium]